MFSIEQKITLCLCAHDQKSLISRGTPSFRHIFPRIPNLMKARFNSQPSRSVLQSVCIFSSLCGFLQLELRVSLAARAYPVILAV
jgi:hypothetical protein